MAIRDINGLKKNRIKPGKHVLIPVDTSGKNQDMSYLTPGQGNKQQQILYRVRRGETLSKIARRHNVTVADIRGWNKWLGRSVRAGQKIKLLVAVVENKCNAGGANSKIAGKHFPAFFSAAVRCQPQYIKSEATGYACPLMPLYTSSLSSLTL